MTANATDVVPGPHCEAPGTGMLLEPMAAYSSFAFVLAALVIVGRWFVTSRRGPRPHIGPSIAIYAVLVAGIGIGSFLQHGPNPGYADLAHDLPLLATLAFVAADSLAALRGRPRAWWWWAAPTLVAVPLILLAPALSMAAQVLVAVAAVGLTVWRARAHRSVRPRVAWAVGMLAVGSLIGTLSRGGWPLCDPTSPWQGHALWHVLAATALVVLAPIIRSSRDAAPSPRPSCPPQPRRAADQ